VSKHKKIAVYGVCKNEEYNIREWYSHIKNADYVMLLDTGSTDNTIQIAEELGIDIFSAYFSPWSETNAKNTALSLLPKDIDICICLDLDQVLITDNWKDILNNIVNDFGIAQCEFKMHTGYLDNTITMLTGLIHKRNSISWIKYRPRLFDYDNRDQIDLPITIVHLPGTKERFDDREILYIKSYLNEEKIIESYRSNIYLLETLVNTALSYFDSSDYDNFIKHYNKIILEYNNMNFNEKEIITTFPSIHILKYAMSICDINNAEKHLLYCDNNLISNTDRDDLYMRLALLKTIQRDFILAKTYLNKVVDTNKFNDIIKSINEMFLDKISTENYFKISSYYGNISWGKVHKEIVQNFIKSNNWKVS
jgi:hypothetical protein